MNARDKYTRVFGSISSLAERVSWSSGVSNMLEWLTWNTGALLGVSKTVYRKQIVAWCHEEEVREGSLEEKQRHVEQKIHAELASSEETDTYAQTASSIASPREALRRAKFFSEDYLNKEFDIFWSLVSDDYLDTYYGLFTKIAGGGRWFTHGNSGLYAASTGIREMQMDNLSYNPDEGLLVANELKLGGRKNRDQILKYALMVQLLEDGGFIEPKTRFLLLFLSEKKETHEWDQLIDDEIAYCRTNAKPALVQTSVLTIAKAAEYASTSWDDLIEFNESYLKLLDPQSQQVEQKLLSGFNEALGAKCFLQPATN